jgi:hypothetical protein
MKTGCGICRLMRERLIAALPLDVRKGSAFPLSFFINSGGYASKTGGRRSLPN